MRSQRLVESVLLAGWLAACESSSPSDARDAGSLADADAADDFKGCAAGIPSFAPGLQATGNS